LALIADTVEEVVEVSSHQLTSLETIIPAEQAVQNVTSAAFFAGVATIEQKLILVLNVDDLLSLTEQKLVLQALGNHDEIKS
jgi:chemotaxis signal transduction protein